MQFDDNAATLMRSPGNGGLTTVSTSPVITVARMIREHLPGIVNGMVLRATNAVAESVNARIQKIKAAACGFRSRNRFRNAILFHLGGLHLYPANASAAHTTP